MVREERKRTIGAPGLSYLWNLCLEMKRAKSAGVWNSLQGRQEGWHHIGGRKQGDREATKERVRRWGEKNSKAYTSSISRSSSSSIERSK